MPKENKNTLTELKEIFVTQREYNASLDKISHDIGEININLDNHVTHISKRLDNLELHDRNWVIPKKLKYSIYGGLGTFIVLCAVEIFRVLVLHV